MQKEHLKQIFMDELQNIYNVKQQIVQAAPNVMQAVDTPELRDFFKSHQKESQDQVDRLNKIFNTLGMSKKKTNSPAIGGLLTECMDVIENYPQSVMRDAAIIARVQRIVHYEISIFGTLRTFAKELNFDSNVVNYLQTSLNEEVSIDKNLSKIAEEGFLTTGVNRKTNRGA